MEFKKHLWYFTGVKKQQKRIEKKRLSGVILRTHATVMESTNTIVAFWNSSWSTAFLRYGGKVAQADKSPHLRASLPAGTQGQVWPDVISQSSPHLFSTSLPVIHLTVLSK